MYFETASLRNSRPSSTNVIAATLTMGFGHRINTVERIERGRGTPGAQLAKGAREGQTPTPPDGERRAGGASSGDLPVQHVREGVERPRGEPSGFRFGDVQAEDLAHARSSCAFLASARPDVKRLSRIAQRPQVFVMASAAKPCSPAAREESVVVRANGFYFLLTIGPVPENEDLDTDAAANDRRASRRRPRAWLGRAVKL